jgi:hypothetical protein
MAREAGFEITVDPTETPWRTFVDGWDDQLKAFEALVRADERAAPVQEPVAWPCVIDEADFEQDTITLKMQCSDYKVGAGQHWLHTTKPAAQPATEESSETQTASAYVKTYHGGKPWPLQPAPTVQEPEAHLWECLGRWSAYLVANGDQADCAPPSWLVDAVKKATPPAAQRQWVGLMQGVRVEREYVVVSVHGGNVAARKLCEALIQEMNT